MGFRVFVYLVYNGVYIVLDVSNIGVNFYMYELYRIIILFLLNGF